MKLIAVTYEGLEKACQKELEQFNPKIVAAGHIECDGDIKTLAKMRTVDKILLPVATFDFVDKVDVYEKLKECKLEYSPKTFAIDPHVFKADIKSVALARSAGQAFVDNYGWKVNLGSPALVIRVSVEENLVVAGVDMTRGTHLSERVWKPDFDPIISAAMVLMSKGEKIVDPDAKDGSVIIEAALLGKEALGVNPKQSAKAKILQSGADNLIKLASSRKVPFEADTIVTAMPETFDFDLPAIFFSRKDLEYVVLAEVSGGRIYQANPKGQKSI